MVMPASRFLALSQPSSKTLPADYDPLSISAYSPSRSSLPQFNPNLLRVTTLSSPPLGLRGFELSTEPIVVVSLLDLWEQFLGMEHRLLDRQDLEWSANPHFIRLLKGVAESAEAHREYPSSLYWMPRAGGPAVKLTDLPEYVENRIQAVNPGYPLWMIVAGATVAVVIVLSPRLRRWVRRAFTVDQVRLWIEANGPAQSQVIKAVGHLQNADGVTADSLAEIPNTVFFDTIPQRYNQDGAPPDLA